MKVFVLLLAILLFDGCLYFNDRGVSAHLYDNCHSYYDENGNFIEKCDENIIDFDEAKDGVIAIKDEIKESINNLTKKIKDKKDGVKLEELTKEEREELQNNKKKYILTKEKIESNTTPCK